MPNPGTVSKILWHFTGGPKWNKRLNRQNEKPKSNRQAFQALTSILETRTIKLGSYKEVVKVRVPSILKYDSDEKEWKKATDVLAEIESSPVCCLADIPIAHLPYHAQRYGRFAIGVHRDSAIRAGFNPVLYSLHDTDVVQSLWTGLGSIEGADPDSISASVSDVEDRLYNLECDEGHEVEADVDFELSDIEDVASEFESVLDDATVSIRNVLSLVKTFDEDEFSTIYCEREWRSVQPFEFDFEDVAMIVLPRGSGRGRYLEEFHQDVIPSVALPREIPIVPWEDLVEYD